MPDPSPHSPVPPAGIGRLPPFAQWAFLFALTTGIVAALFTVHLPAAPLLGALAAAIACAVWGGRIAVPDPIAGLAQGMVGCMIARMLPPLAETGPVIAHWPMFAVGVLGVVAAASFLGWLMARREVLAGSTALWGLSPGAASAMVLMAESYGADARLVAIMQYFRVVMVTTLASVVAWLVGVGGHPVDSDAVSWFPSLDWMPFAATLGLIAFGPLAARVFRIRGGAMLVPLATGALLAQAGWLTITLPPWLLAVGYAWIGWRIGLRFDRPLLIHAARSLPGIVAGILLLIALCGGVAGLLVVIGGVDPLTAYLATSPGGADIVAILTASSAVDGEFVMSMQMARFVTILLIGPAVARFLSPAARRQGPVG